MIEWTSDTVNTRHAQHRGKNVLMLALELYPDQVEAVLATEGLDLSNYDNLGWTALHSAIRWRPTMTRQILLRSDVNDQTCLGETALFMACKHRRVQVGLELMQHPTIDVNMTTDGGVTPLMEACMYTPELALALLEDPRVLVNYRTIYGLTALMYAVSSEYPLVVEALMRHPDVHLWARSDNGDTAMSMLKFNHDYRDEYRARLRSGLFIRLEKGMFKKIPTNLIYMVAACLI